MRDIAALATNNLDTWSNAIERKGSAGRGSSGKISLYGIDRLRALILDLAVRGKLVPQDARDESALDLLARLTKGRPEPKRRKKSSNAKSQNEADPTQQIFTSPIGWHWFDLMDLATVLRGVTYKKSDARAQAEEGYIGLLRGHNIQRAINLEDLVYVPLGKVSNDQTLVEGDIVIAMSSGSANLVGKAAAFGANDEAYSFGAFCGVVRPIAVELFPFMDFYCSTPFYRHQTQSGGKGIGIQNLSKGILEGLRVPLPPLAEQTRIVAKVDELMALCDALERESEDALAAHQTLVETLLATLTTSIDAADLAKNWARLETHFDTLFTTEPSIDTLKQTILDLAVRGTLVEQDPNDEHASKLVTRIKAWQTAKVAEKQIRLPRKPLSPVKEGDHPYSLRSGWVWVRLGEIISIRSGNGLTAAKMIDGGIPVYGGNGVNGYHNSQNINEPTIVVGRVGFYCGSIHVTPEAAWVTDNAFITHFSRDELDLDFMELLLQGTNLKKNENATAQPVISGSKVYPIVVGLPPLAEQMRIVAKVDELMALCEQLRSRLTDAAETQRHLADAITQKAAA